LPARVTIIDPPERRPFVPLAHVGRLAASLLVAVCLGDWLLWGQSPGLAFGLYTLVLAVLVFVNRPGLVWNRWHGVQLLLLACAAAQTAVRPSLSNALVTGTLLLVIAGDTALPALRPTWLRWARALVSALAFMAAWVTFWRSLGQGGEGRTGGVGQRLTRLWSVSWLALVLAVCFGVVLGLGNAMLRDVFINGYDWLVSVLWGVRLPDPLNVIFWGLLATVALVLLVPRAGKWTGAHARREIPGFPVADPLTARLRSVLALAAVNALFFFVNTLDVAYLWAGRGLPDGVTYAGYVHHGVGSLIFAVILSALVLTLIFQQDASVTPSIWLKGLALLWIAQNLFLEVGVLLRLARYVDAYGYLTPRRVYVVVFLILVAAGYGLLVRHILVRRSLKQLLLGNVLAVFMLFYLLQFANVPRLVADYDYQLWLEHPERNIMQTELGAVLGDEMIPLLVRVAESGIPSEAVTDAQYKLRFNEDFHHLDEWGLWRDWQSWTLRKQQLSRELTAYQAANLD
jgi:mannose/fructose/N-acetylgalactosamine-specific phosphotransferase system component IIC